MQDKIIQEKRITPPIAEILCVKNGRAFVMKSSLKDMLKVWKKLWEPFGSCLLNSTANPAKHGWKDDFIKNPQTTIALPFWHIIPQLQVVWAAIDIPYSISDEKLKRWIGWSLIYTAFFSWTKLSENLTEIISRKMFFFFF